MDRMSAASLRFPGLFLCLRPILGLQAPYPAPITSPAQPVGMSGRALMPLPRPSRRRHSTRTRRTQRTHGHRAQGHRATARHRGKGARRTHAARSSAPAIPRAESVPPALARPCVKKIQYSPAYLFLIFGFPIFFGIFGFAEFEWHNFFLDIGMFSGLGGIWSWNGF